MSAMVVFVALFTVGMSAVSVWKFARMVRGDSSDGDFDFSGFVARRGLGSEGKDHGEECEDGEETQDVRREACQVQQVHEGVHEDAKEE